MVRRTARKTRALGQHFLTDQRVAKQIVDGSGIDDQTVVLEIGPGRGALTHFLANRAKHVLAVELDRALADDLPNLISAQNLTVITGDVLKLDWGDLAADAGADRFVMVSNLPYVISSPVVWKLIDFQKLIPSATIMVQREVGERLASPHGSRVYGKLSAILGAMGSVKMGHIIKPGAFSPPPKIDSCVVHITFREDHGVHVSDLIAVVKAGFSQRRKTLKNSLTAGLRVPPDLLASAADVAGIDLGARAESLAPQQFVETALALREQGWDPDSIDDA